MTEGGPPKRPKVKVGSLVDVAAQSLAERGP
jgi:hypothetical protein